MRGRNLRLVALASEVSCNLLGMDGLGHFPSHTAEKQQGQERNPTLSAPEPRAPLQARLAASRVQPGLGNWYLTDIFVATVVSL